MGNRQQPMYEIEGASMAAPVEVPPNTTDIPTVNSNESITDKQMRLAALKSGIFKKDRKKEIQQLYTDICEDARTNKLATKLCTYIDLYKSNIKDAVELGFDSKAMDELIELSAMTFAAIEYDKPCKLDTCKYGDWIEAAIKCNKYHACKFLKPLFGKTRFTISFLEPAIKHSSPNIVKLLMDDYKPRDIGLSMKLEKYLDAAIKTDNPEQLQDVEDILQMIKDKQTASLD